MCVFSSSGDRSERICKKKEKKKKNLHHHSAKHIWHTSAPHCPSGGHTTLMETCPLWQRHSVTDWHLSGGQHGAFTSDLLDFIGILGMLGFFCFTLLSTSWDSWHWWKPNTFKDCHLFWLENGAFAIDLLGFLGFWGCLVFCSTLPSSSWDSWYLWNYWKYRHAWTVLVHQSSTIALLYMYMLLCCKLPTFPMGAWWFLPVLPFEQMVLGS